MIAAIILAAGQSRRMGKPKMLLPWGDKSVIEHVVMTFLQAGLEHVIVVTGGVHDEIEEILSRYPVRTVYNAEYAAGEMLSSLQCGLRALPREAEAALIGLGDQPQIREDSIRLIYEAHRASGSRLVVPSFQRRRGHPWLAARPLWDELLTLQPPESPRDFLNRHAGEIEYVIVDTPTVLADLDTPEDYRKARP